MFIIRGNRNKTVHRCQDLIPKYWEGREKHQETQRKKPVKPQGCIQILPFIMTLYKDFLRTSVAFHMKLQFAMYMAESV